QASRCSRTVECEWLSLRSPPTSSAIPPVGSPRMRARCRWHHSDHPRVAEEKGHADQTDATGHCGSHILSSRGGAAKACPEERERRGEGPSRPYLVASHKRRGEKVPRSLTLPRDDKGAGQPPQSNRIDTQCGCVRRVRRRSPRRRSSSSPSY